LWFGARSNAFIIITFAETPETDLVEIVEAEGTSEGIGKGNVSCYGGGYYVGEVELEEVGIANYSFVVYVANFCLCGISCLFS